LILCSCGRAKISDTVMARKLPRLSPFKRRFVRHTFFLCVP
jgi:hypothetical protein